jgi:hypothetical protein
MTQTTEKGEKKQIFPNLLAANACSYRRTGRRPVAFSTLGSSIWMVSCWSFELMMCFSIKLFSMRVSIVLSLALAFAFAASCKKQHSAGGASGRIDSAGTSPILGVLLVKQVDAWVNGDTVVSVYDYNAARLLVAEHVTGANPFDRYYNRDDAGRIVQRVWVADGDSDSRNVVYADASSGKIAYTLEISGSGSSTYRDSEVYVYSRNDRPNKIGIYVMPAAVYAGYDSLTYDAAGNLSQFLVFGVGSDGLFVLNIGYHFQYDNEINPLFSYDDARLTDEWGLSASPNNLLTQTNQYGDPPLRPSDDVVATYLYRSDKKPATATRGGTALSASGTIVLNTTFYYQ